MAQENVYKALMRARVRGALEMAKAAKGISHKGLKGRVTEILVSELFRPLLPADIGIASGQIVDNKGNLSRQQDVILFDRSILPPFSFDPSAAVIPIEAVLYVIEIKATLTLGALTEAHESASELDDFRYLPAHQLDGGFAADIPKLISVIFALESTLSPKEMNEPKRYKTVYKTGEPYLRAICVAERGYWTSSHGTWMQMGGRRPGDEVLALIGGVLNTYKFIAARRNIQKLGEYIIEPSPEIRILPGDRPMVHLKCNNCERHSYTLLVPNAEPRQDWTTDGFIGPACVCGGRLTAPPGIYALKAGVFEREKP